MPRQHVTEKELIEWIGEQLAAEDSICAGVRVIGRFNRLNVESPEECNWSDFWVEGLEDWPSVCVRELLPRVLRRARSRFNLK
jgi:hypothetical protein